MQQTPSFDTWTSMFLIAVAMGLFLFVLLISGKNKKNYPIAFLVLAFSIILFQYVLYWTNYQYVFPYLRYIPQLCYYVTGPLLLLYFVNLYKNNHKFNMVLHFFPAGLMLIPNMVIWMKYLGWTEIEVPLLSLARNPWIVVGHMSLYTFLILRLIRSAPSRTTQYLRLRHRWAVILVTLYSLFIFSYAAYFVLVRFPFFNSEWDYCISLMMTASIYTIGFFIFKQPKVFDGEFYKQLFIPLQNKKESFEQSLLNELYKNVTSYMEIKKPYIENELRLVHLADRLGFSTHLLSKVINDKSGKNFNQFINDYRLAEAEELLREASDLSIQNIYFEVGFNNKATFYSAFRRKYGCTPSQFKSRSRES
ncbi:MAG: AraC family transcriptional regulator [Flavobacterium sp.]|nr:MAG: AraC family transcriptional regulator [Flavobacterium sp.]